MSEAPRTSVVLGTYNGARYIGAQLASLAAQTLPPLEVIVSDDGSTDETVAIVTAFAAHSPIPVHLHRNPRNLGFSENFLQAAVRATGAYIAFCDQDDIWRPDKIARCQAALAQPGVVLAAHAASLIDGQGRPIGQFRQGIAHDAVRLPLSYGPWSVFFGFSMVFSRKLLEITPTCARGIDFISGHRKLAHDRWIMFLANATGCIAEIATTLVAYRQHTGNQFGSNFRRFDLSRQSVAASSALYMQSAREQRALIDSIAASPLAKQTLFDHYRASAYWDAAIRQCESRQTLYEAASKWDELRHLRHNLYCSVYRTVPGGRWRFKAFLKDLWFIMDFMGHNWFVKRPHLPESG